MNHILIAALSAALPTVAQAADLPDWTQPVSAPQATGDLTWNGFQIGVQGGGAWGPAQILDPTGGFPPVGIDISGGFGGLSIAWLQQWNAMVLGIEGEANYGDISGTNQLSPTNAVDAKIDWFGSVTGRLGWVHDRWLISGFGGVAWANGATGQSASGNEFSLATTYTGWTAGAIVDYALSDKHIIGIRYQYYDFGTESFDVPAAFVDRTQSLGAHTVSVHLSYKLK